MTPQPCVACAAAGKIAVPEGRGWMFCPVCGGARAFWTSEPVLPAVLNDQTTWTPWVEMSRRRGARGG